MATVPKKQGVIGDADRKYIIANMNKLTPEEIAAHLNKNVRVIEKEIKNYVQLPEAENNTIRWHLKKTLAWKHLKDEFTVEELNLIEDKYVKYVEQMKDDINATEESQVINMIKLEILMDRNLKSTRNVVERINTLEGYRQKLIDSVEGDFTLLSEKDYKALMDFGNEITAATNSISTRNSQYLQIQDELNKLSTKLKASRDQRVDRVLDAKVSFSAYLKELLDAEKQERESRSLQLHVRAVEKEEDRLSKAHKYADGQYDNPLLSAKILDKLDEVDKLNNLQIEEISNVTESEQ